MFGDFEVFTARLSKVFTLALVPLWIPRVAAVTLLPPFCLVMFFWDPGTYSMRSPEID